ncbi:MAG: protein TonB, partial [Saprospiraceae bacterium]
MKQYRNLTVNIVFSLEQYFLIIKIIIAMDFGSFEISGNALVTVLVLTIVAILALIFVMRNVFTKRSTSGLKEKYQANPGASPLTGRNKYPDVDVFSLSGTFFNFGLMAAIGLVILAFSWTQYDAKIDVSDYMDTLDEIIETEPPRTAEPPPPPPPPPPPVIQEVPEEDIEEEPIEFKDTSIEEDTEIVDAPVA